MDLSFSGAGFMGCYYFGVVNCWNKYIPRDRVRRVAGASAGSLIAAYYLLDLPLDDCVREIIAITEDIRKRPLGVFDRSNQIVDILPKMLDRMFPEDAHKRVSGRLFVCMTRLRDMKCVIVNEFESKKDLIDALNCSCFIPVWSGNHVSTYKGAKYIDGGFTNNMPVFDEHTIRICCFAGASDISPHDRSQNDLMSATFMGMPVYFTWKNMRRGRRALWPPPASYIVELLERGFHDAKSFILSNDLIQCNKCFKATELQFQPIYSKVTPTISPAASPSVSRASSYMNLADLQRSASFRRANAANSLEPNAEAPAKKRRTPQPKSEAEPAAAATMRQLERMLAANNNNNKDLPSVFEGKRSKSGKLIKLTSLEQVALAKERKSFATRLRERLTRVRHSSGKSSPELEEQSGDEPLGRTFEKQVDMPTIVVDPAEDADEADEAEDEGAYELARERHQHQVASRQAATTIEQIMKEQGGVGEQQKQKPQAQNQNSISFSSSTSSSGSDDADSQADESSDSAVGGLRSKGSSSPQPPLPLLTGRRASQSPAEKFLASRKLSVVASQLDLQANQSSLQPDRFAFAPSQLPSCPPSPNLNRHCTECIRMRQQARMDEIDDSIKRQAQKYGSLESREPESEYNSVRHRLANWFRQLGAPKYSYEFYDSDEENDGSKSPQVSPRRRPSEIPTLN